MLTKERKSLGL